MDIKKTVGQRIRDKRESLNMTQVYLADITGLTDNTISLIENGDVYPKLDSIYKICKALKLKLVDLFKGF